MSATRRHPAARATVVAGDTDGEAGAHATRRATAANAKRISPLYIGADARRGHHRDRRTGGVVPFGASWDRRRPRSDAAAFVSPSGRRWRGDPREDRDGANDRASDIGKRAGRASPSRLRQRVAAPGLAHGATE